MSEKREPLFVRYANREVGTEGVIKSFIAQTEDTVSLQIAEETLTNMPDLTVFRKDFRAALEDIIENGIHRQFINYVDSYMKPSLMEKVSEGGISRVVEKRFAMIKEKGSPWIEAILCYGVILYLKAYGINELKKCPVCTKIFTTKGKYAKYCSENCKSKGTS